ncbi:hypothetical protein C8J57DRAFT_17476 [Mycena rebaudengoi]|nr:hypothetical protein C8J57DRAFT_17476 [Mycena rebaudengoi]
MCLRSGLVLAARLSARRCPPTVFIRASHDAYSDTRLDHFLQPLRYPDEPNSVRRHYFPLISELDRLKAEPGAQPLPPLLTRKQLVTLLDLLATSGRPPDLECIRQMFAHLPVHFDTAVTPDLHTVVLAAFMRQGYVPIALGWIAEIPNLPPNEPPTRDHFHTFIRGCGPHVKAPFLRGVVVNKMRRAGCRPDTETFTLLARAYLRNSIYAKTIHVPETYGTLFADMKAQRLDGDPSILALFTKHYMEHGFQQYAEDLESMYHSHFPDVVPLEDQQRTAWFSQLKATSQAEGVDAAITLYRQLASEGCPAAPETFRAILGSSRTVEDLATVGEELGLRAGAAEYTVLVNNNVWVRKVHDAVDVYEAARAAGIVPVAGLVGPLIRALSAPDNRKDHFHNRNLDTALGLYTDLDAAFPAPEPGSPEALALNDHTEHSEGPDIDIYTSLLRGLSMSSNVKTAVPVFEALLEDMKSRGINATTAMKLSHLIIDMRNCDDLDAAFECYRARREGLTEYGYLAVLHAFSRLSLRMGHPDRMQSYFDIVEHMRKAGFRITDRVYTDVLQQFAELAAMRKKEWRKGKDPALPLPPELFADLAEATRQIHDVLTLDPAIPPASAVWNQLMDTYQRIDDFADCYRVWEMLYVSGVYGPISVSIIFDACGHAGQLEIARKTIRQLFSVNYVFNLHNWNTLIECLCRMNRMSDALHVLCVDMGSVGQNVKPDVSSVKILLQAAESKIQYNTILQSVRRHLPELWADLPDNIRPP